MATQVRLQHVIQCNPEQFWENFHDDAFNARMFGTVLGFPSYRLLERTESGDKVRRRLAISPKLDMPAAVAKILGDQVSYYEQGEFDRSTGVYRFELQPNMGLGSEQAKTEGLVRVEALANGTTNRIIEATIEVRVFGLGGMLERFAAKSAKDSYDAHAVALNQHFQAAK